MLKTDTSQLEEANSMKSQNEVSADQGKPCSKLTRKTVRQYAILVQIQPMKTLEQCVMFCLLLKLLINALEQYTDISQNLGI